MEKATLVIGGQSAKVLVETIEWKSVYDHYRHMPTVSREIRAHGEIRYGECDGIIGRLQSAYSSDEPIELTLSTSDEVISGKFFVVVTATDDAITFELRLAGVPNIVRRKL